MLSRHQNELMLMLEQIEDLGAAHITTGKLRRWYERDRVTRPVWRDIIEKWNELRGEEPVPLFIGDNGNENFILVYGKGLTADDTAYLRPLEQWVEM